MPRLIRANPASRRSSRVRGCSSASESYTLQKTLGVFVEEAVGMRDRLFITAAVRSDQNSAFGTKFQRVFGFGLPHWKTELEACLHGLPA